MGYIILAMLVFIISLLAFAPWGTLIDVPGLYFYRYNSGITLALLGSDPVLLTWKINREG